MMNEDTIKGKWTEFKGEILKTWGEMKGDELDKTNGNVMSILGLIQQRYGAKKEEIEEKFNRIVSRFTDKTETYKNDLRNDRNQNLH